MVVLRMETIDSNYKHQGTKTKLWAAYGFSSKKGYPRNGAYWLIPWVAQQGVQLRLTATEFFE